MNILEFIADTADQLGKGPGGNKYLGADKMETYVIRGIASQVNCKLNFSNEFTIQLGLMQRVTVGLYLLINVVIFNHNSKCADFEMIGKLWLGKDGCPDNFKSETIPAWFQLFDVGSFQFITSIFEKRRYFLFRPRLSAFIHIFNLDVF